MDLLFVYLAVIVWTNFDPSVFNQGYYNSGETPLTYPVGLANNILTVEYPLYTIVGVFTEKADEITINSISQESRELNEFSAGNYLGSYSITEKVKLKSAPFVNL